jgi:hypothetical protein
LDAAADREVTWRASQHRDHAAAGRRMSFVLPVPISRVGRDKVRR